jgi:hypothetical protein
MSEWDWRNDPVVGESPQAEWDWQNDPVVSATVMDRSGVDRAVQQGLANIGLADAPPPLPEPQRKLGDLRKEDRELAEKFLPRPRSQNDIATLPKGTPYIGSDGNLLVAGGGAATLEQVLAPLMKDETRLRMQRAQQMGYPNLYAGLMRGGAGVAAPVARALGADYDAAKFQAWGNSLEQHAEEMAAQETKFPIASRNRKLANTPRIRALSSSRLLVRCSVSDWVAWKARSLNRRHWASKRR